jgi:GNAT superfamily N-acetyltransferase
LLPLGLATAEGFRSLSLAADGGQAEDVGGALCWYSSSFVPVFNGAGLFHEHLFSTSTLSAVDTYFGARARPYCLVTVDGLVPDTVKRLQSLRYSEFDSSPAMRLDRTPERRHGPVEGLRIAHVQTFPDLLAFRSILTRVFAISPHEVNLVMGDRVLWIESVRHYVGYIDGTPVGTASLVTSGPMPGIWNVGTLPEFRKRGIASAMMYHMLDEAQALGHTSSMLLASTDGLPLYRHMGYKTITTIRMFVPTRARMQPGF